MREHFFYFGKRSSRFYKYFFSYILIIILILFSLGSIVYGSFIETLRKEVETSNVSSLVRIQNTMDMHMRNMERIAVHIQYNGDLQAHKLKTVGYDSIEAVKQLEQYKSGNSFLKDIAFFHSYAGTNLVYSTKTVTTLDTFFKYEYSYNGFDKADFLNLLENMNSPFLRPTETVKEGVTAKTELMTYIYPNMMSFSRPYSVVLFFIEKSSIESLVKDVLKEYEGFLYILDEKGSPITCMNEGNINADTEKVLEAVNQGSDSPGITEVNILGEKYSLVRVRSHYNRWSYVTVIRSDQFMKKVYSSRNLFIYVIFSIFIIGSVIAFVFATGNYLPLRVISDMVSKVSRKNELSGGTDEVKFITNALDEISKEKDRLLSNLKGKDEMLREQLLLKLLKGKYKEPGEWNNLNTNIILDQPVFLVMLFQMDDNRNEPSETELLKYSVRNVVEELSQRFGAGYAVELMDEPTVALLLNLKNEYAKERYMSELAFKTKEFFKQHFGINLTIGIGNLHDQFRMICESYSEARRAVYYRLIKGSDNVIFYQEVKEMQKEEYRYPINIESILMMAIKQGNLTEIDRITEDLKQYMAKNASSQEAAECIRFGIINALTKTMEEMDVSIEESLDTQKEGLFNRKFYSIDEMGIWIKEFCRDVCMIINKHKESKNYNLMEKIYSIINKRYKDNTLCLEQIAFECGVSPSYVCRFFKNQTGYPLMQYIDQMRIEEVKKMLKKTDLSLKDVLKQVGYTDQSNFIRKFKSKEGITPSQFRNIANSKYSSGSRNG